MADSKKSILEEVLEDSKLIQEALNANSKEILRGVAREEIDEVVKESLEEDYLEEDIDTDVDTDDVDTDVEVDTDDTDADEVDTDEVDTDEVDVEDENYDDIDVDVEDETELEPEGDAIEGDYEVDMGVEAPEDETVELDMTNASNDEVIAIYKKLTDSDDIEVIKDDESGDITLNVNEPGEFVIKNETNNEPVETEADYDVETEYDSEDADYDVDGEEDEDIVYEVTLDESEDIESVKAPIDSESGDNLVGGFDEIEPNGSKTGHSDYIMSEDAEAECEDEDVEEITEKIQVGKGRTVANNKTSIEGAGARANKINESKYKKVLSEAKELKAKNGEYKESLSKLRTMLAETVVFNTNLTYVTKLFMEHSTTSDEKSTILGRFDNEVATLKESKRLFRTISSELKNRKPVNESIDKKLNKEVSTSSSAKLNESTAYINEGTSRIIELMKRVDKR